MYNQPRMKILVLAAGGFHLGYAACYGNDWIDTPHLDDLAAQAVVFDHHYADFPHPAAVRRAWRTGLFQFPTALASAVNTDLLELLRVQGVSTALVVDTSRPWTEAFLAGWNQVYRSDPPSAADALETLLERTGDALDYLESQSSWLLWVDMATLVPPWHPDPEFLNLYFGDEDPEEGEGGSLNEEEDLSPLCRPTAGRINPDDELTFLRLQRTYAAAVSSLDAGLGILFEELRQRRLFDDLLMIFTSDRGWPLGEHGLVGETEPCLHEEHVHLPLLIRLPAGAQAGRRVSALTQPVDLLPTILDVFGLPAAPVHGHSLLPLCRGEKEAVREYACSTDQVGDSSEQALRAPGWTFLVPAPLSDDPVATGRLYLKPEDRWEVNNLSQHHHEWVQLLGQTLRSFVAAVQLPGPLKPPLLPAPQTAGATTLSSEGS
jgi:arylsulfatase A-like enzyme